MTLRPHPPSIHTPPADSHRRPRTCTQPTEHFQAISDADCAWPVCVPSAPGSPDPAPPALCRAGGGPGMHCNRPTALPCPLTIQHLDGARASCQLCWRRRKVPDDHDVSGRVSSCRFSTLRAGVVLDHCLNAAFVRSRTVELSQQYRSCCDSASAA